jgi:hypothetical protein
MRPFWKLALIGSEVTVLAAFTGVGIHLVMQPHRVAFRPPPITLPALRPPTVPTVLTPVVPPLPTTVAAPTQTPLGPELLRSFGQQDKNLLLEQWDLLQRLTGVIERYVETQVQQMERKR